MSLLVLAAAFVGGFFTAYVVGVNNASTFGPLNAAGAVTVFRGGLIVGLASLLGAVTQGGAVANTIGNRLVSGVTFNASTAAIILLTVSVFIIVSTLRDIPMPAAFLLVGGTIGAGVAAGGTPDLGTLQVIATFWIGIPFVALFIGFTTATLLRKYLAKNDRNMRRVRRGLLVLGVYTAYTGGANRAGLPIGPLMSVVDVGLFKLLVFAGLGMLIGAWTASPRIIRAVSRNYSRMGPRRAIAALLSASILAQTATIFGVPISFNETVIFSVIGSGLVEGDAGVSKTQVGKTVAAWLAALAASSVVTYGITAMVLGL